MKTNTKKIVLIVILVFVSIAIPAFGAETENENAAPIVEDLELTTFRGIAVEGNLLAVDPEGDLIDFQIIRAPRKGEIVLNSQTGQFTYTPRDGQRGRDLFTFVAVDANGNISSEATVRLRIQRQNTNVVYSDLEGHPVHFAAVLLAEEGLFVGQQLGERHLFMPEAAVTRGEFLAMAMRLGQAELLSGVRRTGFVDDYEIDDWLKAYVSTAVLDGVITGRPGERGIYFSPHAYITQNEAAVILSNVLGFHDMPVSMMHTESFHPAWAHQAIVNLSTQGIISFPYTDVNSQTLNRAQVAQMLVAAMAVLENSPSVSQSLLGWAA